MLTSSNSKKRKLDSVEAPSLQSLLLDGRMSCVDGPDVSDVQVRLQVKKDSKDAKGATEWEDLPVQSDFGHVTIGCAKDYRFVCTKTENVWGGINVRA